MAENTTPAFNMGAVPEGAVQRAEEFSSTDAAGFAKLIGMTLPTDGPPAEETAPPAATPEPALPALTEAQPPAQVSPVQPEAAPPTPEVVAEPPKPLLTKFQVFDPEGELDASDAASKLKLSFAASGKEYTDVPLDKVVLMAQMGYHNVEREQQVMASKKFVAEAEGQLQTAADIISRQNAELERLLTDPMYHEAARDRFAIENSPAKRAERAERALQQREVADRSAREESIRGQYVNQQLYPQLKAELDNSGGAVSDVEVVGQFTMLTAPYLVRGAIPVERLPEVQRLVQAELVPWIRNQAAIRAHERKQSSQQASRQVQAAKVETALAKRQLARTAAPQLNSAPPTAQAPKPKTFKSADEWQKDLGGLLSVEPST